MASLIIDGREFNLSETVSGLVYALNDDGSYDITVSEGELMFKIHSPDGESFGKLLWVTFKGQTVTLLDKENKFTEEVARPEIEYNKIMGIDSCTITVDDDSVSVSIVEYTEPFEADIDNDILDMIRFNKVDCNLVDHNNTYMVLDSEHNVFSHLRKLFRVKEDHVVVMVAPWFDYSKPIMSVIYKLPKPLMAQLNRQ